MTPLPAEILAVAKSSRSLLVTSVVIAFPLLVLAFGQIFLVFVGPALGVLPTTADPPWPATLAIWLLAVAASLAVCRLVLGRSRLEKSN